MSSDKIRVLHIVYRMAYGGIETFLVSMLRNYDRSRFHMDILYTGPDPGDYEHQIKLQQAQLISCPLGADQVRFMHRLYKILKAGKYSAINSHLADMGAGAILTAKLMNIPARVASYHSDIVKRSGIKRTYMEIMRRIIVRTATSITTSSPEVGNAHFSNICPSDEIIYPVSYGVDTSYFARNDVKPLDLSRFGFTAENLFVGHVGHYTIDKNHAALVKIASRVVKEIPNIRFLLCGTGGTLREEVEREISRLGLSKHFAMVQELEDIRQFYAAVDVFILPSRYEGMPVSIIEAQAAGKPVVASRLDGIKIATANKMRKNLFAVDDVDAFSKCLIDLLKDKEKRITLGKIGQSYVQKNLDIKIAVRKYEKLYLPKELR